jgi:hypothetical protein
MTGTERDAWEQSLVSGSGSEKRIDIKNVRARLVSRTAVDDQGVRLFSDEDAEALGHTSGAGLERLAKVSQKLNLLSEDDLEQAKGNSAAAPSGGSTSP